MTEYVSAFLKKYDYPKESIDTVVSAFQRIKDNTDFKNLVNTFYKDVSLTPDSITNSLNEISKISNVNIHILNLLFFICLSPKMKEQYDKENIDEEIFYETVEDLKYKAIECKEINDVWGLNSIGWTYEIFHLKTFKFGRLEYNVNEYYSDDASVGGIDVKKGDKVIFIHIPSSGQPFDKKSRFNSYEKAYNFYKKRSENEEPVFCCSSWLLFEPNREILGDKSNITSFMNEFKIIKSYEYPDRRDLWRIFGKKADLPSKKLPRDTSMQKAFADWIEKGHFLGRGIGLFIYDPVNKITITD